MQPMLNHNIFKSPITNSHIPHSKRGFTLVEMLIIAPIVILVIGIFVSAIITMTGDVLAVRGKNALAFNIQDALNRIDQDVKASGGYLATNNITLTSPQGYDDNTSAFKNADATNGTMLILNTYATTANPLSSTRNFIYTTSPNACNSALVSQNQKVAMNIIYFVKNNALWRRVIAPSSYATVGCSVPWQQPTCAPGYVAVFCKTQDMKLVDGVSASGFVINYYTSAAATTPIVNAVNNTLSDANRQTALQTASSVNVTINATKTLAGRDVSQSGTIRSSSPNTGTTSNQLALSNSGGGTWAYKRPITITNSSGGALTNYQVQINPFADSNFINNTGLVGSWHLNGGTSGNIANGTTVGFEDMSGNNNNGTANNANGSGMAWAGGKFGGAISLDGTDDYIDAGSNTSLNVTSGVTISAWVKKSRNGAFERLIFKDSNSTSQVWGLQYSDTNIVQMVASSDGSVAGNRYGNGTRVITDFNWHYIVGTYNGSVGAIYIDGVLDKQGVLGSTGFDAGTLFTGNLITSSNPLYIGRVKYNSLYYYAQSQIDEIKIYNRALSATEVTLQYGTAGVPKVRGDYADVRFADSTGATEYSYWQENDGKYWVKIPSLATGDTTINMYYGNPSATSSSSGANTFPSHFASFETSVDGFTGITDSNRVTTPSAPDGVYQVKPTSGGSAASKVVTWPTAPYLYEARVYLDNTAAYQLDYSIQNGTNWTRLTAGYVNPARWGILNPSNTGWIDTGVNVIKGRWTTLKVLYNANNTISVWQDASQIVSSATPTTVATSNFVSFSAPASQNVYFDVSKVRGYAATEPTHAAPSAESAP